MKKIFFSLIILLSSNALAIPETYDSEVKQYIYNNLKNIEYKQKILDKMGVLFQYFTENNNIYAANKIKLTIYYVEVFDIENLPEEQQKVILFLIKYV
jgi:hypothetical protein